VQHQVGHEHASTTAIYTCVSSDFRTRTLRRALDATLAQATTETTAAAKAAATAGAVSATAAAVGPRPDGSLP
jgi:integrase/recombinase XerC